MKSNLALVFCLLLCITMVGCACAETPVAPTSMPVEPTPVPKSPAPVPPGGEPSPPPAATADSPLPVSPLRPPVDGAGWAADGLIASGEYPHQTEAGGVMLYWSNDTQFLYAGLEAETRGWVAVGFDPESRMKGANYVFGYVKDGVAFAEDMFGTLPAGFDSHPPDEQLGGTTDLLEYGGVEMGGVTVIEFRIPLDSGDAYDKPLSVGATYTVLLAQGSADDPTSVHSARGASEITLD